MSIRRIFITIAAVMLTSAVFADSASVTSKKYVDDIMTGYQNKIPGSGTNKLMIYDDETGIGEKSIETTLVSNATSVPTVGAVKTGLDGKQDTITGTAGYVMTGTGNAGSVDERAIYGTTTRYEDSLVTAESVNSGVINAVNNSLRRVNANGEPDDNGTLWQIADIVVALSFLPPGYTQLEYVDMNAGSYLLTNLVPTYDSRVEMGFAMTTIPSVSRFFGGRTTTYGGLFFTATNTYFIVDAFGTVAADRYNSSVAPSANTRYKFTFNNKVAALESNGTTLFTNTFTGENANGVALVINGLNVKGSVSANDGGIYLYSFKMWNAQGELIANYIPATQTSPAAVGFYDTVSGTFKVATSGTFTAGPAVAN